MADVCRICMCQETKMSEIFMSVSEEIVHMVEFCTGVVIQSTDDLPKQICTKCHTDLQIAHKFKMRCVSSDKTFRELLKLKSDSTKCESEIEVPENSRDIKVEISIDYTNNVNVKSEDTKDSEIVKCIRRTRVHTMSKKSKKKEKKPAARRLTASIEPKLSSRRGLNKFKRLFCELCQVKFENRKESVEHKKRVHKEVQSWICEVCGKSYAHQSSQIAHMRSHYVARYCCHHCDYSTYNKYDLIKHVKIHTGDKSYKCSQCTASYRTSSNLRAHERLLHERRRAHACPLCGNAYNDKATLNRHMDAHNGIKRYVCEVCNAGFTKRSNWKRHLLNLHDITIPNVRRGRPKTEILILDRCEREVK